MLRRRGGNQRIGQAHRNRAPQSPGALGHRATLELAAQLQGALPAGG
jgi:hypothetical protein